VWRESELERVVRLVGSAGRALVGGSGSGAWLLSADDTALVAAGDDGSEGREHEQADAAADRSLSAQVLQQTLVWESLKKEFKKTSLLWQALKDRVSRMDELGMAAMRVQLRAPGERVSRLDAGARLAAFEVWSLGGVFVAQRLTAASQLEPTKARLVAERAVGETELRRATGQHNYLQSLKVWQEGRRDCSCGTAL
jgi:hypothetical protein